jgi:hypothetical protein
LNLLNHFKYHKHDVVLLLATSCLMVKLMDHKLSEKSLFGQESGHIYSPWLTDLVLLQLGFIRFDIN